MGDKSPKSNLKNKNQKQDKVSAVSKEKKRASDAKREHSALSAPKKKK
jgi:hypothetical protein